MQTNALRDYLAVLAPQPGSFRYELVLCEPRLSRVNVDEGSSFYRALLDDLTRIPNSVQVMIS